MNPNKVSVDRGHPWSRGVVQERLLCVTISSPYLSITHTNMALCPQHFIYALSTARSQCKALVQLRLSMTCLPYLHHDKVSIHKGALYTYYKNSIVCTLIKGREVILLSIMLIKRIKKHAETLPHIFTLSTATPDFFDSSTQFLIQSFISFVELGIVGMNKSCTSEKCVLEGKLNAYPHHRSV